MELGDGGATLRCCGEWRRRRKTKNGMVSGSGRHVGVQVMASGARTATAHGRAVKRPATGVLHAAFVF